MPISDKLRIKLAQPFGPLVEFEKAAMTAKERPGILVAVGDQIVLNLLQAGLRPDIGIYDGLTRRQPIQKEKLLVIEKAAKLEKMADGKIRLPRTAKNPAGEVSVQMEKEIIRALADGKGWIRIEGEDDLASLVVMAYAKEGTLLLYGQPEQGAVVVQIDAKVKKKAQEFLEEMEEGRTD